LVDRAQEIGLFRWQIVGEATDVSLSARERGRLVRALAEREHLSPDGRRVRVGRNTLDRWIRAYREGGFDGLVPAPRRVANSTPARVLELAVALRSEQPARTAAQIHRIIEQAEGAGPSARTTPSSRRYVRSLSRSSRSPGSRWVIPASSRAARHDPQ
jgi:putative transposase